MSAQKEEIDALRRANRALTALSRCNEAVFRAAHESGLLQAVCRMAVEDAGYRMAWVGMPDAEGRLLPVARCGDDGYLDQVIITAHPGPHGEGPSGRAYRTGIPSYVNDTENDPLFAPWREAAAARGYRSAVALPLVFQGEKYGILVLYSSRPDAFDAHELELLGRLADNLAFGIDALRVRLRGSAAEKERSELEKVLGVAFEAAPLGIAFVTPAGKVFNRNRRFTSMTGIDAGQSALPLFTDDESMPTQEVRREFRIGGGRGDESWLQVVAAPKHNEDGAVDFVIVLVEDATQRRLAERELLHAKEYLEAIYAASPDMIFLHGPDGRLVEVNENVLGTYGFTREEMLSQPFGACIDERYREEDALELVRRAQAGERLDFEFTARRNDGSTFPVEVRLRRLRGKAAPGHVVAIVRDITERKRSEQALRQQAYELNERVKELHCMYAISRLLENRPEPVEHIIREIVATLPRGFRFPELTAISVSAGEQQYVSGAIPPGAPRIAVPLHIANVGEGSIEAFFLGDPDSLAPPLFLPEETSLLAAVRDQIEQVAERRFAEEQLRENEAKLAKAQRIAGLGNWEVDLETGTVHWSEQTWRIFGLDPASGEPPRLKAFLACIHPDDRDTVENIIRTGGTEPMAFDYRIVRPDGRVRVLSQEREFVLDEEGRPLRIVGTVQDITRRKEVEDALRHANAELKAANLRLGEMNTQLIQSEKMASIGQLAAGVAHEINNPVGYISANVGSMQNYLGELMELIEAYEDAEPSIADPQQRASIEALKSRINVEFLREDAASLLAETMEGVRRVRAIVQDLKDFSRVDEEAWQWADLHKGLDSTLNIVRNELKYKADVIKEYGDLPEVECMPSQLNQVFMNLLVNAGHAIAERGTVTLRTGRDGDRVWVAVSDTGSGIKPEHMTRLFDPFFTTKPVGKGTGLGLSLAYGIVSKHGGHIDVQSEVGEGTTFTVWVPIRQSAVDVA